MKEEGETENIKNENHYDDDKSALISAQFTRIASEIRQYDQIIWQIPTVTITITSVVSVVAFYYIQNKFFSGIFLIIGSFFNFTMAISLSKHRLFQDVRSVYLEKMENEYNITHLPVQTEEAIEYLYKEQNNKSGNKRRIDFLTCLLNRSGVKYMLYCILLITIFFLLTGVIFVLLGLHVIWLSYLHC